MKKPHMAKLAKPAMAASINTPRTSGGTFRRWMDSWGERVSRRSQALPKKNRDRFIFTDSLLAQC